MSWTAPAPGRAPRLREVSPGSIGAGGLLDAAVRRLPWFWLAGAPTTLAMLAVGLLRTDHLRLQSLILRGGDLPDRCGRLAEALGIRRPVTVGICDLVKTPVVLGILRPLILLPTTAVTGWSVELIEMALLHELAHVRRYDVLINLVQRVIESLLFFHPAVWWISGWIRLEREHCCDRLVVARTGKGRLYAELLASLVLPEIRPGLASIALAERHHHVVDRIRRVLGGEEHSARLSHIIPPFILALVALPMILLAAQDDPPAKTERPKPASRALNPEEMALVLRRARNRIDDPKGPPDQVGAILRVAAAEARLGQRDDAKTLFQRAIEMALALEENDNVYTPGNLLWIAQAQQKCGFPNEAATTYQEAIRLSEKATKKESLKQFFFTSLLTHQRERGDQAGVQETLRRAREFVVNAKEHIVKVFAPTTLIRWQAQSGDLTGALRMVNDPALPKLQGGEAAPHEHQALMTIVEQITPENREGAALILVEARKSANKRMFMVRGNALNLISEVQARLGLIEEALETARAFDPEDLGPRRAKGTTATDLLDTQRFSKTEILHRIGLAQLKAGDLAGARRSAEEMAQIWGKIRTPSHILYPARRAAYLLTRGGDLKRAWQIADTIDPVSREEIYEVIVDAQRESGDDRGAQATLRRGLHALQARLAVMQVASQPQPNAIFDRPQAEKMTRDEQVLRLQICRIMARQGYVAEGLKVVADLRDSALKNDILWSAAAGLANQGDLQGALTMAQAVDDLVARERVYTCMLNMIGRDRPEPLEFY